MKNDMPLRFFFREYFPGFIGGIFAAYFSVALAMVLALAGYFKSVPWEDSARYIMLVGFALTVLLTHANLMVLWGRPKWVWVLVVVFVACLVFVLPAIQFSLPRGMYGLAVLSPLLGLLALNSRRQRSMRSKMVDIRHQREALRAALRKRR